MWKLLQLITGLHLLKHTPKLGECYVEDLVVHPQHQGKGIGTQLAPMGTEIYVAIQINVIS